MSDDTAPGEQARRDRLVVGVSLALACGLSWLWLLRDAGVWPFPKAASQAGVMVMTGPMAGMVMPAAVSVGPAYIGNAFVMWLLMMVAMMTPSATPMILVYARVAGQARSKGAALVPTAVFASAYIGLWAVFSAVAALTQAALVKAGLVEAAALRLGSGWIAGGLLVAAGAYQLTALKQACLDQCRSPLDLLVRWWRIGWMGTVRLGLIHGLYCIGCCWALMTLLFVVGVMNLGWIAVLALIVLIEKVAPFGRAGARATGVTAIVAGCVVLGATAYSTFAP